MGREVPIFLPKESWLPQTTAERKPTKLYFIHSMYKKALWNVGIRYSYLNNLLMQEQSIYSGLDLEKSWMTFIFLWYIMDIMEYSLSKNIMEQYIKDTN